MSYNQLLEYMKDDEKARIRIDKTFEAVADI